MQRCRSILTESSAQSSWRQTVESGIGGSGCRIFTPNPLIFATQDFHQTLSMTWTRSALPTYLYGNRQEPIRRDDGTPDIRVFLFHKAHLGRQRDPVGIFWMSDSEYVNAVVFNNSGTISNLDRRGVASGFGTDDVVLIREGFF